MRKKRQKTLLVTKYSTGRTGSRFWAIHFYGIVVMTVTVFWEDIVLADPFKDRIWKKSLLQSIFWRIPCKLSRESKSRCKSPILKMNRKEQDSPVEKSPHMRLETWSSFQTWNLTVKVREKTYRSLLENDEISNRDCCVGRVSGIYWGKSGYPPMVQR